MRPLVSCGLVRRWLKPRVAFWGLALALLGATPAQAQFANRSLGASLGYTAFTVDSSSFDWALPLMLQGTLYIENGFELVIHAPLMVMTEKISKQPVLGAGGTFGVRYLLSEESLRPFVGAELVFFHLFRETGSANFFGAGGNVGLAYFVTDTVSLEARVFGDAYFSLTLPVSSGLGAQAGVAAHF
jgi:outer membrane protein